MNTDVDMQVYFKDADSDNVYGFNIASIDNAEFRTNYNYKYK